MFSIIFDPVIAWCIDVAVGTTLSTNSAVFGNADIISSVGWLTNFRIAGVDNGQAKTKKSVKGKKSKSESLTRRQHDRDGQAVVLPLFQRISTLQS